MSLQIKIIIIFIVIHHNGFRFILDLFFAFSQQFWYGLHNFVPMLSALIRLHGYNVLSAEHSFIFSHLILGEQPYHEFITYHLIVYSFLCLKQFIRICFVWMFFLFLASFFSFWFCFVLCIAVVR